MFTIAKEFGFSASHQLEYLPEGHKCKRLHGHNYKVVVILGGQELGDDHFILDFGKLDSFREWLRSKFDHQHLNDVLTTRNWESFNPRKSIKQQPFEALPPTCEVLAKFIFDQWVHVWQGKLKAIRVSESDLTWAEYSEAEAPHA